MHRPSPPVNRWILLLVVALSMATAAQARAGGLVFHGSAPNERLDATASFNIVNGDLQIKLTNNIPSLGIRSLLDTVAFDISGVTFGVGPSTASSVDVAPGSLLYTDRVPQPTTNVSADYTLDTNVHIVGIGSASGPHPNYFDYAVSSTDTAHPQTPGTQQLFSTGSYASVGGPDFGMTGLGTNFGIDDYLHSSAIEDSIIITLQPTSGVLDLNNLTRVSFGIASDQEGVMGNPVPEPSTLILILTGMIPLAFFRGKGVRQRAHQYSMSISPVGTIRPSGRSSVSAPIAS